MGLFSGTLLLLSLFATTISAAVAPIGNVTVPNGASFLRSSSSAVPFYRYYNTNSGDHFYTTNWDELKGGGQNGWIHEGSAGQVFSNPVTGTVPLYRYVSGEHFYTTNWAELGGGSGGYAFEGIACYIYQSPREDTRPLFRYYNHNTRDHFYTTNWAELGGGKGDYKHEGITGYIL